MERYKLLLARSKKDYIWLLADLEESKIIETYQSEARGKEKAEELNANPHTDWVPAAKV